MYNAVTIDSCTNMSFYMRNGFLAGAAWIAVPFFASYTKSKHLGITDYLSISAADIMTNCISHIMDDYFTSNLKLHNHYLNMLCRVAISKIPSASRSSVYKTFSKAFNNKNAPPLTQNEYVCNALISKLFYLSIDDFSDIIIGKKPDITPQSSFGFNIIDNYAYRLSTYAIKSYFVTQKDNSLSATAWATFGEVSTTCFTELLKTLMWYRTNENCYQSLAKIMLVKTSICIGYKFVLEPSFKYIKEEVVSDKYKDFGNIMQSLCTSSIKTWAFRVFKDIAFHNQDHTKTI